MDVSAFPVRNALFNHICIWIPFLRLVGPDPICEWTIAVGCGLELLKLGQEL